MKCNHWVHTALASGLLLAYGTAYATNGYFLTGSGYRSQSMGGVGIAYGRDSLSVNANPANLVNTGMRGDLGFGVLNAERYAATGTASGVTNPNGTPATGNFYGFDQASESENKYFIMPEMGMSMPLTDKLHVGIAVVGNGGGNTTYRQNFFSVNLGGGSYPGKDVTLGADMMQLAIPVSVAYKVDEDHAFGASLVLAATRFRIYGLQAFQKFDEPLADGGFGFTITSDPNNLTNQGFDYSFGAGMRFGWQGEFLDDRLTLGLVYTSRSYMTKFDKYRGLFAEQGDLDIPENYGFGIAFKPVKNLVIAADVMRINYSDVAAMGNRGPGSSGPGAYAGAGGTTNQVNGIPSVSDSTKELGNDNGMGFGWEDQVVYKLGVQYGVNKKLQLRAGYNYGKSPIPNDQLTFNTLFPAVTEKHYSLGFTYRHSDELEITGAYVYAASNSQCSPNRQNVIGSACVNMHQNIFGLSLGWVLDHGPGALDEYGTEDWAGISFDGWYAGLGVGQSNYRDFDAASANTRSEGWKVYGGYQFNDYLALEGGYVNLNDMQATNGTVRTNIATEAWALGALLSYPMTDKISVVGKFGYAYMQGSTRTKNGTALTVHSSDDDYEPNYGVGVSYKVFDSMNLRAEWERFDRSNMDIDLITAGLQLKF